jgi:hypothetical protein
MMKPCWQQVSIVIDIDEALHANARGDADNPHVLDHEGTNDVLTSVRHDSLSGGPHAVHPKRVA